MGYFSDNLKKLRETKGLSRKDMTEKLGITQAAYGNYEMANREPKITQIIKIANVLGVTTDELLGMETTKLQKYVNICNSVGIGIKILPECEITTSMQGDNKHGYTPVKEIRKDYIALFPQKYGGVIYLPQSTFIETMDTIISDHTKQVCDILYDKIALTFLSNKN